MPDSIQTLSARLKKYFPDMLLQCSEALGETTIEVAAENIKTLCLALRDEETFGFSMLIDICAVDYSEYGKASAGKSSSPAPDGSNFAVVYHLLSCNNNQRLRVRTFVDNDAMRIDSVVGIWAAANWFEREAFDLFGILFEGHPDLRRLLTDYGFVGHPFRKDFPLIGNVEMRYDPDKKRVIYEPVSIEPRVLVPRVIRDDHRYVDSKD
ncbi:MAG: NADH-quinone oxidoreductase subunit C [Gammaproteobacteria bacterium]|nr:NADH-quinone oxidoreductase subunit C [Gammaproteobacteria bacterium]